jgi:FlaA1/EpsC-like NDP-sugar epimerase
VLVTGETGSVGGELVGRLLGDDPVALRVFDNSESALR